MGSNLKNNDLIRSQFCTDLDSSAVVTCAILWPDLVVRITINLTRIFTSFQLWGHKRLVKWTPGMDRSSLGRLVVKITRILYLCFIYNQLFNSLTPGRWGNNITRVISKHMACSWGLSSYEIALMWMPQNTFDNESRLVQSMAWCCQATSHYFITRPQQVNTLTHWGRMTHICISKLTIIGSDNGLSPGRCHTIIWTNAGILSIWPLGTNFSEILIEIHTFSFRKIHFKMSGKWQPFFLSLNVLTHCGLVMPYGDRDLGQHWLRWWLAAWWDQAITWTNVDLSTVRFSGIHVREIHVSQEIPQPSITKINLKIT